MAKTKRNDVLKIIAMVTMLIDHLGVLYFPDYLILRTIGRIAFPIFAYQLALGYTYTSNKKLYAKRLLMFGLIAQIPYMFLNNALEFHYLHFNVILLFLYAVGMLYVFDKAKESFNTKSKNIIKGIGISIALGIIVFLPYLLELLEDDFFLSYGTYGLLLILLFYNFKDKPYAIVAGFIAITFSLNYLSGVYYYKLIYASHLSYFEVFTSFNTITNYIINYSDGLKTLTGFFFQARSIMAIFLIIALRNTNYKIHLNKYIGYWFYPAHLAVLIGFRFLLDSI